MTGPAEPDVRQVSQLHAQWRENGDGVPGTFALSVVLDDGARQIVAVPDARDVQALIPLIDAVGGTAYLDLARGALITGGLSLPVRPLRAEEEVTDHAQRPRAAEPRRDRAVPGPR